MSDPDLDGLETGQRVGQNPLKREDFTKKKKEALSCCLKDSCAGLMKREEEEEYHAPH